MNKNYINIIRKSLNSSKEDESKHKKKIIFPKCSYNSESVFIDANIQKTMKGKSRDNKNIQTKKRHKTSHKVRRQIENTSDECLDWNTVTDLTHTFDDRYLTPSKSEITNSANIDSDSDDEFQLHEFSHSRDNVSNESFTEAHSGINEEFNIGCIESVRIRRNKIVEGINEVALKKVNTYTELNNATSSTKNLKSQFLRKTTPVSSNSISEHNLSDCNDTFTTTDTSILDKQNDFKKFDSSEQQIIEKPKYSDQQTINEKPTFSDQQTINELESLEDQNDENHQSISQHMFKTNKLSLQPNDKETESSISNTESLISNVDSMLDLNTNAKYFHFETFNAVILSEYKSIPIYGKFIIKVLKGNIEILGSILDKSHKNTNIYSPRGYSLLVLKNVTSDDNEIYLKNLYEFPNSKEITENMIVEKNSAVFLVYKLQDNRLRFAQKYISQQIFPKIPNADQPQVIFEPKDNMNLVLDNENWDSILKLVNLSTKLFIVGGKGVGKSTYLRYMINRLLCKFEKVRIIDLDPGQSEFFVPGCLSVSTVSEFVIGPNFTHITNPERAYLCDISVADPVFYIRNVKALMDYVSNLEKIPTLINYMGYTKGLGIKIASSVITLVNPTNVVQINSRSKNKNFASDLIIANIRKNCDYFGGDHRSLSYRLHKLDSLSEATTGWKLEARQARELCILAYLGEGMTETMNSLTDHNLPMYKLKLSSMKLRDFRNNEIPPAAINANLVALCNQDEKYGNFICLGFAVVRGIDLENDYIVLITQVSPNILSNASHLVLSSVFLPPSIYMTPQNIRGLMPYVMEGELTSLAQLTKRSYLPAGHTSAK